MARPNRISLNTIFVFCLFLLISCKQEVEISTLDAKIVAAVASRKIPDLRVQKVPFTTPESIIGSGPQMIEIFTHLENYLPTIKIEKGKTETLPLARQIDDSHGKAILSSPYHPQETSLDKICEEKEVNGVIVLHKGKIVYENYPDMDAADRHMMGSVSKTFIATIIAHLADEGKLNEQDHIGKYLSEFKDSPLESVTIEHLLRMTSGINCREKDKGSFTDPDHCFYKLLQHSGVYEFPITGFDESVLDLLSKAGSIEPPGQTYDYTSANSVILTILAERLTSKPFHQLVQDYIWTKIGAEDDARVILSNTGVAGSYGLMLMRLRDLARYGLAFTDDASNKIASNRYLDQIHKGNREMFRSETGTSQQVRSQYYEGQGADFQSYHWDVVFEDGDFFKTGFGGQGLYISPSKRLVIAFFSANKDKTENNINMMTLVRSLALLEHFKI